MCVRCIYVLFGNQFLKGDLKSDVHDPTYVQYVYDGRKRKAIATQRKFR